jgi:hypothetical protein
MMAVNAVTRMDDAARVAARLPALLLDVERIAHTVYQGTHGRRRQGVGDSFWQFRDYTVGDSADRIDWRQSARSSRVYVREREWEAAQTVCLWNDISGSMHYASTRHLPTKKDRAELLMLALGSLVLRGGEKVMWLGADNPVTVFGRGGLDKLLRQIPEKDRSQFSHLDHIPRQATSVLCSDFLMSDDALYRLMQTCLARQGRGALVHILDPIEASFAFSGRVEMRGCEDEPAIVLPSADALRDAYQDRLAAHILKLQNLAQSMGWSYLRHITDEAPHVALTRVYQALSPNNKS